MPRRHRMVRGADFTFALRKGRHGGTRHFVVHYATGQSEHRAPLVGFAVPKRQIPLAVDRKRVARRLRHLMREHLGDLEDYSRLVITVKAPAAQASSAELRACLDKGLSKVGIDADPGQAAD
nr:ribonuclease P protein component [Nanchangia anserum]